MKRMAPLAHIMKDLGSVLKEIGTALFICVSLGFELPVLPEKKDLQGN